MEVRAAWAIIATMDGLVLDGQRSPARRLVLRLLPCRPQLGSEPMRSVDEELPRPSSCIRRAPMVVLVSEAGVTIMGDPTADVLARAMRSRGRTGILYPVAETKRRGRAKQGHMLQITTQLGLAKPTTRTKPTSAAATIVPMRLTDAMPQNEAVQKHELLTELGRTAERAVGARLNGQVNIGSMEDEPAGSPPVDGDLPEVMQAMLGVGEIVSSDDAVERVVEAF